jgi:hypothetical protein
MIPLQQTGLADPQLSELLYKMLTYGLYGAALSVAGYVKNITTKPSVSFNPYRFTLTAMTGVIAGFIVAHNGGDLNQSTVNAAMAAAVPIVDQITSMIERYAENQQIKLGGGSSGSGSAPGDSGGASIPDASERPERPNKPAQSEPSSRPSRPSRPSRSPREVDRVVTDEAEPPNRKNMSADNGGFEFGGESSSGTTESDPDKSGATESERGSGLDEVSDAWLPDDAGDSDDASDDAGGDAGGAAGGGGPDPTDGHEGRTEPSQADGDAYRRVN